MIESISLEQDPETVLHYVGYFAAIEKWSLLLKVSDEIGRLHEHYQDDPNVDAAMKSLADFIVGLRINMREMVLEHFRTIGVTLPNRTGEKRKPE